MTQAHTHSDKSHGKKPEDQSHAGLYVVGALVAAAAGAYYVYGNKEELRKRAKKVRGWVLKAKGEVLHKLENMKQVDEELYNNLVDTVMKKYESVKGMDLAEIALVAKELKSHWKNIKKEVHGSTKSVTKATKKTVKKVKKAITE